MTTSANSPGYEQDRDRERATPRPRQQRATETKASTKTTELYVYVAAVIAVVATAMVVKQDDNTGIDPFGAYDAIQFITYLTIGYMIARGLAKSGSRETYTD